MPEDRDAVPDGLLLDFPVLAGGQRAAQQLLHGGEQQQEGAGTDGRGALQPGGGNPLAARAGAAV